MPDYKSIERDVAEENKETSRSYFKTSVSGEQFRHRTQGDRILRVLVQGQRSFSNHQPTGD